MKTWIRLGSTGILFLLICGVAAASILIASVLGVWFFMDQAYFLILCCSVWITLAFHVVGVSWSKLKKELARADDPAPTDEP